MNDQANRERDENTMGGSTPNPRRQRRKSARTRIYLTKPGDIDDLRARLWWALERAMRIVQDASNMDQRLKAISCMSTTAGVYLKTLEVGEMDGRVQAIEAMLAQAKGQVMGERKLWATSTNAS
jgi:DNA-binding response OmpR family regulator